MKERGKRQIERARDGSEEEDETRYLAAGCYLLHRAEEGGEEKLRHGRDG